MNNLCYVYKFDDLSRLLILDSGMSALFVCLISVDIVILERLANNIISFKWQYLAISGLTRDEYT